MRKYSIITMFGVFGALIGALMLVSSTAFAQQTEDRDAQIDTAHHGNPSAYDATIPMGEMHQMMSMMRQMMGHMPMMGSPSLTTTMPMTDSMPMMAQMMGYCMQMMGLHMQMMGEMHGATGNAMPMMGNAHPEQQQGMMRDEMTDRQMEVAEAGRDVMPFDLDVTTHIFEKTQQGGVQQVVADDPDDAATIEQIRTHLSEQAERFAQGNFRGPQIVHGAAMPGLHELMMGADQIDIAYRELPSGAQILYTTGEADLIAAIHRWFDAQVVDHGSHAKEQ